jgi:hypothetical protein
MVQLQFNAKDWVLRANQFKTAQLKVAATKTKDAQYLPIPNINLGIKFKAGVLAIGINSQFARPTWSFGGKIYQVVGFPNNFDITPIGGALANEKELPIDKVIIWQLLPRITNSDYTLLYSPPRWFRDVRIKVWQYTGEEYNFVDSTLNNIETKLNYLLQGK